MEEMEGLCADWPGAAEQVCADVGGAAVWRGLARALGEAPGVEV